MDIVVGVAQCSDGTFLLVQQFRLPVGQPTLELPAGHIERDEAPADAMRRELLEETGHDALQVRQIGEFFTAPHASDELAHVFACETQECIGQVERHLDPDEQDIAAVRLTQQDLTDAINAGRISDAKSIAAWHLYHALRFT